MEIDNRLVLLGDQLKEHLGKGSKVKMAVATFSMFAYQSLKEELEQIDELKFIFTSPTFTTNEVPKNTANTPYQRNSENHLYLELSTSSN